MRLAEQLAACGGVLREDCPDADHQVRLVQASPCRRRSRTRRPRRGRRGLRGTGRAPAAWSPASRRAARRAAGRPDPRPRRPRPSRPARRCASTRRSARRRARRPADWAASARRGARAPSRASAAQLRLPSRAPAGRRARRRRPARRRSRRQESVAYGLRHARGVMQRVVAGAGRPDERRLLDALVVPGGAERRLAGENDQRQAGPDRRRQRGQHLRQAGAAGDRGHADLAALAGVGHGRGDGAVLVPDVDHAGAELHQPVAQFMLASPSSAKQISTPSCRKAPRQHFVGLRPGHASLTCAVPASSRDGTMTSPRAIRRAVRTSPADLSRNRSRPPVS